MIDVKALPIVDALTTDGQPLVAILGPNHEVYWEAVKKMEGILPLIFESRKGGPLKEYKIYGNTPYQEWTPSPEKERTANLFDNSDINASQVGVNIKTFGNYLIINGTKVDGVNVISVKTTDITLKPGTYTLSVELVSGTVTNSSEGVYFGINRNTYSQRTTPAINISGKKGVRTFTLTEDTKITSFDIACGYGDAGAVYTNAAFACMLNEGSTALPYEPYGYRERSGPCEVKGVGERTKNLLDISTDKWIKRIPADDVIVEGNTVTVKADYFDYVIAKLKPNTDYYIKWKSEYSTKRVGVAIATVFNGKYATVIRNASTVPFTFNTAENTEIAFLFYAGSGSAGETKYSEIMLNEGSEPLLYESYGCKTIVVDNGKNLFDDKNHGKRLDTNGNLINDINAFCTDYISTNTAQRYTADCYINHSDSSVYAWILCCYDDNKNMIRRYTNTMRSFSFTIQSGEKYFILCKRYSNSQAEQFLNVQLEEGTTATEYEPYREPIETTIYHDEPYFANDYIRKDKDGGVEHRGWKKRVLDGSEQVYTFTQSTKDNNTYCAGYQLSDLGMSDILYYNTVINNFYNPRWIVSHYKKRTNTTENTYRYLSSGEVGTNSMTAYHLFIIFGTAFDNEADFKAWLKSEYNKGTPVTVYYPLATPTDTPKDLPDIVTASGYNSIDTDTQIKPEKMEIAYR